jgi:hypothetical protein
MSATELTVRSISRVIDSTTNHSINDITNAPTVFFEDCDDSNGNKFANITGQVFLWVKNTSATDSLVATIVTTYTKDGYALDDMEQTIDAGDEALLGPFTAVFNDGSGEVTVNWSSDDTVSGKVCACRLNPST